MLMPVAGCGALVLGTNSSSSGGPGGGRGRGCGRDGDCDCDCPGGPRIPPRRCPGAVVGAVLWPSLSSSWSFSRFGSLACACVLRVRRRRAGEMAAPGGCPVGDADPRSGICESFRDLLALAGESSEALVRRARGDVACASGGGLDTSVAPARRRRLAEGSSMMAKWKLLFFIALPCRNAGSAPWGMGSLRCCEKYGVLS